MCATYERRGREYKALVSPASPVLLVRWFFTGFYRFYCFTGSLVLTVRSVLLESMVLRLVIVDEEPN